jgi:predicted DNA-binding protein YlxM (UPF0122 family)
MSFEKDLKWALYLDLYGSFLTERQSKIFDLYYNEDCSLAEIAEQLSISRQGVLDGIKKAQAKLNDCEKKLGLVAERLEEKDGV